MCWQKFIEAIEKGEIMRGKMILPYVHDQKPEELLRNFYFWLEDAGLIYGSDEQEACIAMRGACECALAATQIAAIRAGAKDAEQCDTNGNWPLHNILAKAINLADRAAVGVQVASESKGERPWAGGKLIV